MKNYNPGIGILKFFAAFLVVWIHLGVRGVGDPHVEQFTIYSDALCRIAVPLFFIITREFGITQDPTAGLQMDIDYRAIRRVA